MILKFIVPLLWLLAYFNSQTNAEYVMFRSWDSDFFTMVNNYSTLIFDARMRKPDFDKYKHLEETESSFDLDMQIDN